jgi:IS1 family transposase
MVNPMLEDRDTLAVTLLKHSTSMNRLQSWERAQIVRALVEGNSIRSTVRITGFAKATVTKLLGDLGKACAAYQNDMLRNLTPSRIECDEIWSFVGMKEKSIPEERRGEPGIGDAWTWTALDPDSKLMCSWLVGERSSEDAEAFMADLAGRLANRVQITTDGFAPYVSAIAAAFGSKVDYAMLIKDYGVDTSESRRFSPPVVRSEYVRVIEGAPDEGKISTSYVERSNLTMRMGMRRFTRLTNGFSKKVENHAAMVALFFMYYNFARPHKTLGPKVSPAMAAGIADHLWNVEEICRLLESN